MRRRWTGQHEREIRPTLGIRLGPHVFVGEIPAACKHTLAIEYSDLAMVAQVAAIEQGETPDRQEEGHLAPSTPEPAQRAPGHMERAKAIDEETYFHALLCARNEALDDRTPGRIRLEHISLNVDAPLGAINQSNKIG